MEGHFKKFNSMAVSAILTLLLIAAVIFVYRIGFQGLLAKQNGIGSGAGAESVSGSSDLASLQEKVIPSQGIELPVKWGDLGKKLIDAGVIDKNKFEELYSQRSGGLSEADKKMIEAEDNGNIVVNSQNSGLVLNLLWALGLGNKNNVLETGPMMDKQYGGAENFASTGGWTLAKGNAMNHYSGHQFIILTREQQALVEAVAKNIYRPCCGNATHFPDCNHGMAMLGFLELAASQDADEKSLYGMALVLNSYWFPDNYTAIAQYLENKGIGWDKADSKEILGINFSSAQGYQKILAQIKPKSSGSGGSCGV